MGKLTAEAIVERAMEIGDSEGLDAVTIRRLATDLGVTPMALYWHFKNKEQLLIGMADHLVAGFTPEPSSGRTWEEQLRELVEGLIGTLRRNPCAKDVLDQIDQMQVPNFLKVWDLALGLTEQGGFTYEESCLISKYLLQSAISIANGARRFSACASPEEAAERQRLKRLALQSLPAATYPHLVKMAAPMVDGFSDELYDTFGVDLVLSGIFAMAERR